MRTWTMMNGFVISVALNADQFDRDLAERWNLLRQFCQWNDFPMWIGSDARSISKEIEWNLTPPPNGLR